jgi:hypothetical protein
MGFVSTTLTAYAFGYYDGRATGCESNPFSGDMVERAYYTWGYEAGVADYCDEIDVPNELTGE